MKSWVVYLKSLLPLGLLLAACGPGGIFEDSSQRATRQAQTNLYIQTIAAVQTQASTVAAIQATAEGAAAMGTQIVQLQAQNRALEATLDAAAAGVPFGQVQIPQPPAAQPSGQGASTSNQLFPQNAPPTPTSSITVLEATMATGVRDSDGCPQDRTNIFPRNAPRIYLVVRAASVQAGTTFYSRWIYGNETRFVTVSWTPDRFFDEVCIWFFITSNDTPFDEGAWVAQLIANEISAASQNFTIGS